MTLVPDLAHWVRSRSKKGDRKERKRKVISCYHEAGAHKKERKTKEGEKTGWRKNGKEDKDNDWERPDLCGGGAPLATDATRVVLCDIRGYFCARVICQPLARRGWADRPVKPLLL
ncbi:hypothetical protein CEXT_586311 [Caerostris extrusa]|uniref:Uncharacterized protein n=1 Tax=Caerostris extrusa TaxID=172846 RepID=A0AAV4RBG7_CAEEX|nr:hypothetical protein CEXT_586311 [Caerostris extrusa]